LSAGLSLFHVKSHLQKYRNAIKHPNKDTAEERGKKRGQQEAGGGQGLHKFVSAKCALPVAAQVAVVPCRAAIHVYVYSLPGWHLLSCNTAQYL
jgi:hypothetical protein